MNRTFKIIARYGPSDRQPSYDRYGKEGTQFKKTIYNSLEDFEKYSPNTIKTWGEYHDIEVYEMINSKWERKITGNKGITDETKTGTTSEEVK